MKTAVCLEYFVNYCRFIRRDTGRQTAITVKYTDHLCERKFFSIDT